MKKLIILSLFASALLMGCGSTKSTTQVVTQTSHDTLYLNKLQYDSIFIDNVHYIDRSKDTIRIRDVCVQYRYKLLQDTVYKSKTDSIPVIKEVTVTKEVKYVPNIYKWALGICITLIIISIIYFVWKIKF